MNGTPYLDRARNIFMTAQSVIADFGDERAWRDFFEEDVFYGIDGKRFKAPKFLTHKPPSGLSHA